MQAFCARCVEEGPTRLFYSKFFKRSYWFCAGCRLPPGHPEHTTVYASKLTTVCSSQNRPELLEELERRLK